MPEYKELSYEEGVKSLSIVWTINIDSEENYFPNPFTPRDLRFRTFFLIKEGDIKIYIHLNENEKVDKFFLNLINSCSDLSKMYFYGAYNQVNVVQMRATGSIENCGLLTNIQDLMQRRLLGEEIGDKFQIKPEKEEVLHALKLLEKGTIVCFKPVSFAYNSYERG